jgi:hypothetical protein
MHKYLDELPMADPGRDEDAKRLFPYREMTAEEYHAREGHKWVCFSFGEYRYADSDLDEWIHTLDDIFFAVSGLGDIVNTAELEQHVEETES